MNNYRSGNKSDDTDFGSLYLQNFTYLCVFAKKIVRQDNIAEDIVQEVFTDLYKTKKYKTLKPPAIYYLKVTVRNRAIDYIRRLKKQHNINIRLNFDDSDSDGDFIINAENSLLHKKMIDRITETIATLPEQEHKILLMSKFEHKKCADIASELNISIRTVEAHLYSALKKMKKILHSH